MAEAGESEVLTLYPNKRQWGVLAILAGLVTVGLWFWIVDELLDDPATRSPVPVSFGAVGAIVVGWAAYYSAERLIPGRYFLRLDREGFTDCVSGTQNRYEWSKVEGFFVTLPSRYQPPRVAFKVPHSRFWIDEFTVLLISSDPAISPWELVKLMNERRKAALASGGATGPSAQPLPPPRHTGERAFVLAGLFAFTALLIFVTDQFRPRPLPTIEGNGPRTVLNDIVMNTSIVQRDDGQHLALKLAWERQLFVVKDPTRAQELLATIQTGESAEVTVFAQHLAREGSQRPEVPVLQLVQGNQTLYTSHREDLPLLLAILAVMALTFAALGAAWRASPK